MFAILNINKPVNLSSRDMVTNVVRALKKSQGKKIKAGHAGTLDPIASGVLIVCLGKATRLIPHVQRFSKTYVGHFDLDVTSDSADTETAIQPLQRPVRPDREQLQQAIPAFLGEIEQRPPAYSAISIGGQRAYRLARQGIEFEIKPKKVRIDRLEIQAYEYPHLELLIECGTGTYIRSLGRDLARAVQSDAVMTQLQRTTIGPFDISTALDGHDLDQVVLEDYLLDPLLALGSLPRVELSAEEITALANGRFIDAARFGFPSGQLPDELAALDRSQQLVAILEPRGTQLKSRMNLGS